ncbi:hypothetical protein AGMMS49928_03330 [Spirochaetia bacterium]|nr:hypothetical protein AGMMS49928_03330 [Spirochaetia bacterium]
MVLAGILAATSLTMAGCENPAGGGGGNGGYIPSNPHEHTWGTPVWEGAENASWAYYTDNPATWDTAGLGHKIGTEEKIRTCTTDGTTEVVDTRTYVPEQWVSDGGIPDATNPGSGSGTGHQEPAQNTHLRVDIIIPANRVLQSDGGFTVLDPSKEVHNHNYQWVDTGVTDWFPKAGDSTKEIEKKEQKEICTDDQTLSGASNRWVATGNERDKAIDPITSFPDTASIQYWGNPDIDIIATIGSTNAPTGNAVHTADGGTMVATINLVLPKLSQQAKALETFFAGSTGATPAITATLTELKNAQAKIRVGKNGNNANDVTITNFLAGMDAMITALEAKMGNTTGTAYDAYMKGQYLINRDWLTENGDNTALNSALTAFTTARGLAGYDNSLTDSYSKGGRGTSIPIGSDYDLNTQLGQMETATRGQILTALGLNGLTGAEATRANAMADMLIKQLQDAQELRAFAKDIEVEQPQSSWTMNISNYPSTGTMQAQLGPQSSDVRLASVNAEFPLDGVKTGSRGKYDAYTGAFQPLNKKDDKMA